MAVSQTTTIYNNNSVKVNFLFDCILIEEFRSPLENNLSYPAIGLEGLRKEKKNSGLSVSRQRFKLGISPNEPSFSGVECRLRNLSTYT
jgi:hypothetical protein